MTSSHKLAKDILAVDLSKYQAAFKSKVSATPTASGCLEWLSKSRLPDGYGMLSKNIKAHRFAFKLANPNVDISGKLICHSCHNPSCCNAAHLSAGSTQSNADDLTASGRRRSSGPKLNYQKAKEIRRNKGIMTNGQQAKKYGVSLVSIKNVLSGATYNK